MRDRLESILMQITQREARQLLTQLPQAGHRSTYLADGLAREGILVMRGEVPQRWQAQAQPLLQTWMELHQDIYDALAAAVFPAFTRRGWMLLDDSTPTMTLLDGECNILIEMHAQHIVPYLAMRHGQRPINELELRGLVSFVLQEVFATDLDGQQYNYVCNHVMDLMRELLRQPVRQLALTGAESNWLTRQGVQRTAPAQPVQRPYRPQPLQPPSMTPTPRQVQSPSMTPPPPPEFDENPTEPTIPITDDVAAVGRAGGLSFSNRADEEDTNRRWRFPVPRLPRDQRGS